MKFIADSCSNFNLPAVEGDVSISTDIQRQVIVFFAGKRTIAAEPYLQKIENHSE